MVITKLAESVYQAKKKEIKKNEKEKISMRTNGGEGAASAAVGPHAVEVGCWYAHTRML